MSNTKKRGVVAISPELLLSLLRLEGQILDIRINHFESGQIEIILEHPLLPDCLEGDYPYPLKLEDYQRI